MADPFIATCLLFGGLGWAALVVIAMSNHPTGGTDFAMVPFLLGLAAGGIGLLWWVAIIIGWLL